LQLSQETAETTALQALGWLAGNEELLPVFLGTTGASVGDVRQQAMDPDFLGAVLDFIMMDDAWVMDCAGAINVAPERIVLARQSLPGGAQINWT